MMFFGSFSYTHKCALPPVSICFCFHILFVSSEIRIWKKFKNSLSMKGRSSWKGGLWGDHVWVFCRKTLKFLKAVLLVELYIFGLSVSNLTTHNLILHVFLSLCYLVNLIKQLHIPGLACASVKYRGLCFPSHMVPHWCHRSGQLRWTLSVRVDISDIGYMESASEIDEAHATPACTQAEWLRMINVDLSRSRGVEHPPCSLP